jgi:hypothetical protein
MWPSFVYTFIRILRWLFRSFPFELYFYRGEILVHSKCTWYLCIGEIWTLKLV